MSALECLARGCHTATSGNGCFCKEHWEQIRADALKDAEERDQEDDE